jgi:hypothetical protein
MSGSAATARELVALIRHLDIGAVAGSDFDAAEIEYLDVTRWNGPEGSGGHSDARVHAIVRDLAREKLGSFPVEEIGAATLAELDGADRG